MDDKTERKRPAAKKGARAATPRTTRGATSRKKAVTDDATPYREAPAAPVAVAAPAADAAPKRPRGRPKKAAADAPAAPPVAAAPPPPPAPAPSAPPVVREAPAPAAGGDSGESPYQGGGRPDRPDRQDRNERGDRFERRGRFQRRRRGRNRFGGERGGAEGSPEGNGHHAPRQGHHQQHDRQPAAPPQIVAEAEVTGWFDPARGEGGFIRRASASYLEQPGDPFVPGWMVRQLQLRRADLVVGQYGHDHRRRPTMVEVSSVNDAAPDPAVRRKDFKSLTASFPDRRLTLETGRPAKFGPEVTRRAIDLIAPIGYGQRALIVAPARAGKTTLLQAITEGVHLNHPNVVLMLLLVDERPEEVSEAISWGVGEVIASSFDQPAARHVQVTEMVTERAHRLVEQGKDVVIVLDSITRMGRAFNAANRGGGRTMSGGLDSNAMAKPKAFFGSARNVAPADGGGSLTIIATALVETGSRMDDVIFEEFKGTGNCEIKLDRSLAERRIFPAIDIPASGTRREEKLYKPEHVPLIYALRRGLQQMPAASGMEWLIKRIAGTSSNDELLRGLV